MALTTKPAKSTFRNPRCREVAGVAFYSDVWRQVRRLLEPIKLQQTPHIGPFAIGFHFYEQKAVEVREETPGDHSFLMLWTISSIYSPANNLYLRQAESVLLTLRAVSRRYQET